MFSKNDKVSIRQVQALLILDFLGTAIIVLPRRATEITGNDSWVGVFLGGLLMLATVYFYGLIWEKHPRMTFYEIAATYLKPPLARVVSMVLAVKLLLAGGFELRVFAEILGEIMLFRTPIYVTMSCVLLMGAYLVIRGYECRGRVGEVLFLVVILPLLLSLFLAAFSCDYYNLTPTFTHMPDEYGRTAIMTFFSFHGLEFLFFVFPHLEAPEKGKSSFTRAALFISVLTAGITFLTVATFGEEQVQNKLFPVLQMMNTVDFPGAFLDRQDIIVLWFWTASAFFVVSGSLFYVGMLFARMGRGGDQGEIRFLWLTVTTTFLIALIPDSVIQAEHYLEWILYYGGLVTVIGFPILLFLLYLILGRGKHEKIS